VSAPPSLPALARHAQEHVRVAGQVRLPELVDGLCGRHHVAERTAVAAVRLAVLGDRLRVQETADGEWAVAPPEAGR